MAIGQDRGESHRLVLSRLATDDKALTGPNHTVPVLEELVHGDMVFAVFPKLYTWKLTPWYYNFSEVLDSVTQTVEVGRCKTSTPTQSNSVLPTGNCFLS
jgi:hypothetical protein